MNKRGVLRWLAARRVAIFKGGWSRERPISLKSGKAVEASFRRLGIKAVSIDVNRSIAIELQRRRIDFCFLALHGSFGEDGRLQGLLDVMKVGYTGAGALASAVSMDKHLAKTLFKSAGVPTADWCVLSKSEFADHHFKAVANRRKWLSKGPLFVKPADQGSAIGVSRVDRASRLNPALRQCFKFTERCLIERFVPGRELTVGILGDRLLPVVEIIPAHRFYDFHSKYAKGGSRHLVPAPLSTAEARRAQRVALDAFRALRCEVYGRVDIIMNRRGDMFVLEVNTIPGMTEVSLLPDAARAAGLSFDDLVLEIIDLSRRKHRVQAV